MKWERLRKTQVAAISAVCTFLLLAAYWEQVSSGRHTLLPRTELRFRNVIAREGKQNPPDPRLVFLAIDNDSVSLDEIDLRRLYADIPRDSSDYRALELISQQWPWPRETYALILDKLIAAGARVVVLDLLFPKATPGDEPFRAALERHRDRVVVGSNFVPQTLPNAPLTWVHALPTDSLIPQSETPDPRVAYVNFWATDPDEVIRRAQFRTTEEALRYGGSWPEATVHLSLAARTVTQAGLADLVPPGVDTEHYFRYSGGPSQAFRARSVFEIFVPRLWSANFGNGTAFRDKIVLIGPYGNWQHDEHQTPYGLMPGPVVHLNVINALLHKAFLREMPPWATIATILAGGLLAWVICVVTSRPLLQVLYLVLATAGVLAGALLMFNHADLYVLVLPPLLALNVSGGACFLFEFVLERIERARTRRTFERYVSKDVVKELLDNPGTLLESLGGRRKPVTVLFSDLRGFTSLAENADPHSLVNQLNEYFQRMVRHVFAHRGTLDKFMGDGLMAHWGSIVGTDVKTDACNAVHTARAMCRSLEDLNNAWIKRGLPPVRIGIGINHGDAIVGNIGCEEKMEVSVIGDAVNLASRIEGVTKEYHTELLLGEQVARLVEDQFILRTADLLQVMGKSRPVEVFAVIEERKNGSSAPEWLSIYEEGIRAYRKRDFVKAAALFAHVMALRPDDRLGALYLRRSHDYSANPPPKDWNGVFIMRSK